MTRWLLASLLLAGCATDSPKGHTYLCGDTGRKFVISVSGDSATLSFGDQSLAMQRVPSASGARYNGVRSSVFTKDDEALIELDGYQFGPCQEVKPQF